MRNNQFDAGADDFKPLPPANAFIYNVEYDPRTGHVLSVTFAVWFNDSLSRDYNLYHTLSYNKSVVWTDNDTLDAGVQIYGFKMWYGPCLPWPVGEYWFCVYWGEIGVGAIPFEIVEERGRQVIRGPGDYKIKEPLNEISIDTVRVNF
jgi:hypothetical protein